MQLKSNKNYIPYGYVLDVQVNCEYEPAGACLHDDYGAK